MLCQLEGELGLRYSGRDARLLYRLKKKGYKTFPQALKRIDATGFMSEPFEAQDKLKLRPPY